MDPLRELIDAVRVVCPDADIDFGPCLTATGSPTVVARRIPGVPQPSWWATYYDILPAPKQYSVDGWYVDLAAAVTSCVRFLREK